MLDYQRIIETEILLLKDSDSLCLSDFWLKFWEQRIYTFIFAAWDFFPREKSLGHIRSIHSDTKWHWTSKSADSADWIWLNHIQLWEKQFNPPPTFTYIANLDTYVYIHNIYIYIYVYIYMCVCVHVHNYFIIMCAYIYTSYFRVPCQSPVPSIIPDLC